MFVGELTTFIMGWDGDLAWLVVVAAMKSGEPDETSPLREHVARGREQAVPFRAGEPNVGAGSGVGEV